MNDPLFARLNQTIQDEPPKAVFLIQKNKASWQTVTYHQFSDRINLYVRGLAGCGIQPGEHVAMMLPPSVDLFALVFACLQSGIVPVMVDPAIGLSNVTPCLAECQLVAYLGSFLTHTIRRLYRWGKNSLRLNLTLADIAGAAQAAPILPPHQAAPEDEAFIIYTSGSTGLPKGVIYTRANLAAQIEILVKELRLDCNEIDLPAFPLFAMIDCLLGVTAVIPDLRFPAPGKVDPDRMAAAIRTQRVDTLFVSPAALARLARHCAAKQLQLPGLKKVFTAGAPAPVEVQALFTQALSAGALLLGAYGATESLTVSLVNSHDILNETHQRSAQGAGVCVGKPVAGVYVRIIPISDEAIDSTNLTTLPPGVVGEITVQGPGVSNAYVGREQANRLAKIIPQSASIIHRMGDLGYLDEQGRLWFCGRKSQRVDIGTTVLFTEQVEGIFNAHPLVYRTALVGVNKEGKVLPVIWVELTAEGRVAHQPQILDELRALAQTQPLTQSIQHILFHPAFPTDVRHNSKIIRETLAKLAARRI
jgi:acyl-CoA synthetase (AMP-forming)/AMP-acid ligase II